MNIPTPETITPEWFTQCLRAKGIEATVIDIKIKPVGTGQMGDCLRYQLSYEQPVAGAPVSLIGKFPADDPGSRAAGMELGIYHREVEFYKQLQSRIRISTPYCYFSDIAGSGPDFCILMEDLAPAQQGDQLQGCSAELARVAVRELVGLHAPSWRDQSLLELPWLQGSADEPETQVRDMYRASLPGFLERFGLLLAEDQRQIISQLGDAEGNSPLLFRVLPEHFSLIHVDYRLDNLMIDDRTNPPKVTAVDWQSVALGAPLNDVAYFIGAGLLPDVRRNVEEDIVRQYHQGLLDAGVSDFDWQSCWNAYRRGSFAGLAVTVITSMLVERTERGNKMFATMAQRHSRHAIDVNAQEFLH